MTTKETMRNARRKLAKETKQGPVPLKSDWRKTIKPERDNPGNWLVGGSGELIILAKHPWQHLVFTMKDTSGQYIGNFQGEKAIDNAIAFCKASGYRLRLQD